MVHSLGGWAALALLTLIGPREGRIVFGGINRLLPLRVSREAERTGLNVVEHGARNELATLLGAMQAQADSQDLSLRAPVEPFTEVGQIARLYNHVLESLQRWPGMYVGCDGLVGPGQQAYLRCRERRR